MLKKTLLVIDDNDDDDYYSFFVFLLCYSISDFSACLRECSTLVSSPVEPLSRLWGRGNLPQGGFCKLSWLWQLFVLTE